ncbi:diiron oxygenase [Terrimonas pollutisoli]|uniref:diiron oxygenase n=1 Tax=Terrimonas pollutisoli TaxID=3034147 RepID=UPI0023EAEFFA|nr:diiron oxygenase [Terrimonas sp. H1YJ31]
MNENFEAIEINMELISRLMRNWPKRASVRGCYFDEFKTNDNYDPSLPDYPKELVPFWDHPSFDKVDDEIKFKILTWGWITYNTRTIHAEEKIVNPSFDLILQDTFPGTDKVEMKNVVHQSLIDERFHSMMHYNAMEITKKLRSIRDKINLPDSVTYRRLLEHQSNQPEDWKQKLMVLACGIVSETSINAFLSLLSKSTGVQPRHALVSKLHDVDEFAHSSLLVEIAKSVFVHFNKREKTFFVQYLPMAMDAFCVQDFSSWSCILEYHKIKKSREIIEDCRQAASKAKMVNDYSGLKRIAEELNIMKDINYEFN